MDNTMKFDVGTDHDKEIKSILKDVYSSLEEKGYNPLNQMVGYLLSGDPTYITSHNNARSMIRKIERDELIETLLKAYME